MDTCCPEREAVAQTRGKRLFTKNTGACEAVRRCIRSDACPVLEGYGERLVERRSCELKPQ
jgi:hypothetical protein